MIAARLWTQLTRRSARSPLWSKRIVITRAAAQSDKLLRLLVQRGAVPLLYPCIAIAQPDDPAPLDAAIVDAVAGAFDAVILTSANAAERIHARLNALGIPPFVFGSLRIAAVGAATAQKAADLWDAKMLLLPERYDAEALSKLSGLKTGSRVFLPQSSRADPTLAASLAARAIDVHAVTAYNTVTGSGGVDFPALLVARRIDVLTFASPSAVGGFVERLTAAGVDLSALEGLVVSCIGPSTRRAAESAGLSVHAVPPQATLEAWVEGLEAHFARTMADRNLNHD